MNLNTSLLLRWNDSSLRNDSEKPFAPQTTLTPLLVRVLTGLIYPTGFLANAAVLLPFLCNRSLRTPFSAYVISLCSSNFLRIGIQAPIAAVTHLQPTNPFLFNRDICSFIFYSTWVLGAGAVNMHGLIAVNRLWAILHPLSYRRVHSLRFAVLSCIVLWATTNVLLGIHPLVERLREKAPNLNVNCHQSSGKLSFAVVITMFMGYLVPLVVAITPFPVMLCVMARREKRTVSSVTPVVTVEKPFTTSEPLGGNSSCPAPAEPVAPGNTIQQAPARIRSLNSRTKDKQIFLGMLTASVFVCYLPFFIYFALQLLIPNFFYPTWLMVLQLIFQCQSTMDVVLFVLMLRDLRLVVGRNLALIIGQRTKK